MRTTNFKLSGLTCSACSKLAQRKISKISGVKEVSVETSGRAEVISDLPISKSDIENALFDTEYKVIDNNN